MRNPVKREIPRETAFTYKTHIMDHVVVHSAVPFDCKQLLQSHAKILLTGEIDRDDSNLTAQYCFHFNSIFCHFPAYTQKHGLTCGMKYSDLDS